VVLARALVALVAAGCGQSLFDAHPGRGSDGGPGGDDMPGPCTSCIANAAGDFDGTATGKGGHWRYLEDQRNHFWTAMASDGTTMTGTDSRNRITTCAAHDVPACKTLPGALVISSAGSDGIADPAIEFTASAAQAIRFRVQAAIAGGDEQTLRLYRGSREDALFTTTIKRGTPVDQLVILDSLPGDRFLLAIAPATGGGATDLALQLTAEPTGAVFPASCQLALPFEARVGNTTRDVCGQVLFTLTNPAGGQAQLVPRPGPYFEQHDAAQIIDTSRLRPLNGKPLDHSHDVTIQFWAKLDAFVSTNPAYPFSDVNIELGGGIAVGFLPIGPTLDVMACTDPLTNACVHATAPLPNATLWQFIRVVHTRSRVEVCVDGAHVAGVADTSAAIAPAEAPELGNQFTTQPGDAHFKGTLDDVRVISGALPCE